MKENDFKESYRRKKNLHNALKTDEQSIFFASEKITKQLVKKLKNQTMKRTKYL